MAGINNCQGRIASHPHTPLNREGSASEGSTMEKKSWHHDDEEQKFEIFFSNVRNLLPHDVDEGWSS